MENKKQSLDLNAYGVEEMSVAEMRETDGGLWGGLIIGLIVSMIVSEIMYPNTKVDYQAGFDFIQ
jgi:hypothetical protein